MTLILRGANESFLDEIERSVHDALSAVSRLLLVDPETNIFRVLWVLSFFCCVFFTCV